MLERIARPAPSSTPFTEIRFLQVLSAPLVVRGRLDYTSAGGLARNVQFPFVESTTIAGGEVTLAREGERTRRFSLSRVPELRALLGSFAALLEGDAAALERDFAVSITEADGAWRLGLVPREPRVARRIARIEVTGRLDEPRCVLSFEPDEDLSLMLLGTAADLTLADPPERSVLERDCRK